MPVHQSGRQELCSTWKDSSQNTGANFDVNESSRFSPPHISNDYTSNEKIYYDAEVLPPVRNTPPKRRLNLAEASRPFRHIRRPYNASGKRRRSYKRYRPRKNNGYYSRNQGIRSTPTRRIGTSKPDWNGYAKLDVPSFGFYYKDNA